MLLGPRKALIRAAESWLGTPFHHFARVRGAGVDCVNLICAVYEAAGLIEPVVLPFYHLDWYLHREEELMLHGILEHHARSVDAPLCGDIAVFRWGRCYAHAAIVEEWPSVIHAFAALGGVVRGDATKYPLLDNGGKPRPVKFYSMLQ